MTVKEVVEGDGVAEEPGRLNIKDTPLPPPPTRISELEAAIEAVIECEDLRFAAYHRKYGLPEDVKTQRQARPLALENLREVLYRRS